MAKGTECWPVNQRVAGLIPSLGHRSCRPGSQLGVRKRQSHIDVSLLFFLPPLPSRDRQTDRQIDIYIDISDSESKFKIFL